MKTLIVFILGLIVGACSLQIYQRREGAVAPATATDDRSLGDRARSALDDAATKTSETAGRVKDATADKLRDWHLTPDEIKSDLAKTGQVVRTKAQAAGEAISDARIVTVIKAKYVLDRDLSAWDIGVDVSDGAVTLTGKIPSAELLGRAVRLALETDGVRLVTARIGVAAK